LGDQDMTPGTQPGASPWGVAPFVSSRLL
jgi:hypothetical protein